MYYHYQYLTQMPSSFFLKFSSLKKPGHNIKEFKYIFQTNTIIGKGKAERKILFFL